MPVYTVALSKGGSTKTTTAAELVAHLAAAGRRVLAIDLDQQGNLTTRLGLDRSSEVNGVAADVLTGEATVTEAATDAPAVPGAQIIAGTHDLAAVGDQPELVIALRDELPTVAGEWDDVVIDTPPALSTVTMAGLAAADVVVAAMACETEAFDQLDRLVQMVAKRIAPRLKPGQEVHWIVPTRHDGRRLLDREVMEVVNERFPGRVTPPVCEAVAARDAYTDGKPVSIYAPSSKIAADYRAALAPVLAASIQATEGVRS